MPPIIGIPDITPRAITPLAIPHRAITLRAITLLAIPLRAITPLAITPRVITPLAITPLGISVLAFALPRQYGVHKSDLFAQRRFRQLGAKNEQANFSKMANSASSIRRPAKSATSIRTLAYCTESDAEHVASAILPKGTCNVSNSQSGQKEI